MTSSIPSAAAVPRFFGLIPCAGTGSRAGTQIPKQYQPIAGQPMVRHTLDAFAQVRRLSGTLLVLSPGDGFAQLPNATFSIAHCGGSTRALSVLNGLNALLVQGAGADDWVLVHDAARCLVTPAQIDALIDACQHDPVGGLLAHRVADTLKAERSDGAQAGWRVATTLGREGKWLAQTPQMFRIGALVAALKATGDAVTDEAGAMEAQGMHPRLVPGSAQNFKVTYPDDFALAEMVLLGRRAGSEGRDMGSNFRMGQGWDVHALVPGRKLIIGGVEIPYHLGLLGHSDADVLLHAITDALLGAAGLGDIGTHFPDTSADYADADSWQLLQRAGGLVRSRGWQIGNIDCTVIAQAPKLVAYKAAMRERIASALAIEADTVNVKAKTAEKMGPVGEGKSVEAEACALLFR